MNKVKKYFTTGDIARYCEVDVNTVKNWIRNGDLQAFNTPSGHYRIPRDRFLAFTNELGFPYDPTYFGQETDSSGILVIDDDPNHRKLVVHFLNELYKKARIETAENGFEGYRLMLQHRPRLIILDLVMPGITGLELLRIMRSREDLQATKVLVISAFLDKPTIRELKQVKVDRVISKPLKKEELKKHCDFLLSRSELRGAG